MFICGEIILIGIICFILGAVFISLPGITIEIKKEDIWDE